MSIKICLLAILWPAATAFTQPKAVKPLTIGDTLPDIVINNLINYHKSSAHVSEIQGNSELLILDFWATWCGPCLHMLRTCDTLKDRFQPNLSFLAITRESNVPLITRTFNKLDVSPVCSVADTVLHRLFPHNNVPHYVWIDRNNIVKAITFPDDVNEQLISKYLDGQEVKFSFNEYHTAEKITIDRNALLLPEAPAGSKGENLVYRSIVTEYDDRFHAQDNINYLQPFTPSIICTNYSIRGLFEIAYNVELGYYRHYPFVPRNRTFLEVPDPDNYLRYGRKGFLYCYNLLLPSLLRSADTLGFLLQKFRYMQEDLMKAFNLRARTETRILPCLLLQAEDTALLPKVKQTLLREYGTSLFQGPLDGIAAAMDSKFNNILPIVNDVKLGREVALRLSVNNWKDLEAIRRELAPYKLKLVPSQQSFRVLVLYQ